MKNKIIFIFILMSLIFLLTGITVQAVTTCESGFTSHAGVCFPISTGMPSTPIITVLDNFLGWGLIMFGFFSIIAFAISGIQYLTSAGDEKLIEIAKRNMKWSIMGVIVGVGGYVIVLAISKALEAKSVIY